MHQVLRPQPPAPDLAAIKARQQATWAAGDFGRIGVQLQIVGESLCEAVDLRATDRVLDVAAGNGNVLARGGSPLRRRHVHRLRSRAPGAGTAPRGSDIDTEGYKRLLRILDVVENDTWQLFEDMNRFNPFAAEARRSFIKALQAIERRISDGGA